MSKNLDVKLTRSPSLLDFANNDIESWINSNTTRINLHCTTNVEMVPPNSCEDFHTKRFVGFKARWKTLMMTPRMRSDFSVSLPKCDTQNESNLWNDIHKLKFWQNDNCYELALEAARSGRFASENYCTYNLKNVSSAQFGLNEVLFFL